MKKQINSFLVSFEGIEGAGKTTQIHFLQNFLQSKGFDVHVLREPGTTEIGEKIRQLILSSHQSLHPMTEVLLFLAARSELNFQKIHEILSHKNQIIILDRYIDSTLAYQGAGRELGLDHLINLHHLNTHLRWPDLTFYLKIDLLTSEQRMLKRGNAKDYFESQKKDFFSRVISGYEQLQLKFPQRFRTIDSTQNETIISEQIQTVWNHFYEQC